MRAPVRYFPSGPPEDRPPLERIHGPTARSRSHRTRLVETRAEGQAKVAEFSRKQYPFGATSAPAFAQLRLQTGKQRGRSMTWLVLNPGKLLLAVGPGGNVFVLLLYPHEQTGLVPGTELAIQMTPTQARRIAHQLLRKADEAEAGLPRA